jgi:hypothetical protein
VRTRKRVVVALCAAVLVGGTAFLAWQEALPAYHRSQPVPAVSASETLALPEQVYDPAPYVPATDRWGPPGPVGLVFQGRLAREGFSGEIARPWYAISARTGTYARLAAPHLGQAGDRLWVGPQGTQVAWWWPGGIARYDTMTGESESYPVDAEPHADESRLAWSPDSTRIAFGRYPVRVLDVGTGEVTDLPLQAPPGSASAPAWTADGRWVTVVVGDAVEAVAVGSGERRTLPARVGGLRAPEWSSAGDLAGVHATRRRSNLLRVVHAPGLGVRDRPARVVDAVPQGLVVEGFWGWAGADEVVLTGLRPETGALEQAMALSLPDNTLRPYMLLPSKGRNWGGLPTVSLATDLLRGPTRAFEEPAMPWSPTAKLRLCMLLALFPVVYLLVARRPRRP